MIFPARHLFCLPDFLCTADRRSHYGGQPSSGASPNVGAAVYVFRASGTVFTQQQKLTAGDSGNGDNYGEVVSLDGSKVIIGASDAAPDAAARIGCAHVERVKR